MPSNYVVVYKSLLRMMQRKSTVEDKKDKDPNKGGISKITIHNYDKQGNQASPKGSQVKSKNTKT